MGSEMIPKVRNWLETQGYTLEMRAASAFRAIGFDVRQSSHYDDPETGKSREIDVTPQHYASDRRLYCFRDCDAFSFAIASTLAAGTALM